MDQANKEEVMATIHEFLKYNFPLMQKQEVQPTDLLLELGVLDSLGLLVLVEHIESTYEIRVGVDQMVVENFGSLDAIAEFIVRQRGGLPNAESDATALPEDH